MTDTVLYQFPISHYCEKVRWALDLKRVDYAIRNQVPVLHIPVMLKLTRRTQVPVLRVGDYTITDSSRILEFLEQQCPQPPLYFDDPELRFLAQDIEGFADHELGPHVRRVAYYHLLPDAALAGQLLMPGAAPWTRAGWLLAGPGIIAAMRKGMRIDADGYQRSLDRLRQAVAHLSERLAGGHYFAGDRFSVADLSVAALLAPLAQPPGSPYQPRPDMPEAFAALCQDEASDPLFDWCRRIYQEHRAPGAGSNP